MGIPSCFLSLSLSLSHSLSHFLSTSFQFQLNLVPLRCASRYSLTLTHFFVIFSVIIYKALSFSLPHNHMPICHCNYKKQTYFFNQNGITLFLCLAYTLRKRRLKTLTMTLPQWVREHHIQKNSPFLFVLPLYTSRQKNTLFLSILKIHSLSPTL